MTVMPWVYPAVLTGTRRSVIIVADVKATMLVVDIELIGELFFVCGP